MLTKLLNFQSLTGQVLQRSPGESLMRDRQKALGEEPNVIGGDELVAKQSAVDEQGKLRAVPIDGVIFRPVRPVPHEDGYVTEVARASWDELADLVVQVHLTTTWRLAPPILL
jgi:hypothetical protein